MYFVVIFFVYALLQASACPDPITTVHIQHHDGPIYVSPDRCDNQITLGNYGTCNRQPCGNQPIQHTYPYHVCETDCKCVTKQLGTSVPINTLPQNYCAPGTYYCPEYTYGYGTQYGSDCPISSEGLIPLLKSYLGQKCPKNGCQCGQCYSAY